ncbi:MAG: hypothetical protein JKY65_30625 [Planctomycetes bacterium]|nr:hypothetical protein [Planctomycetota bacterium]
MGLTPADFSSLERLLAERVDFERVPPASGFELARVRALAAALGEPGAAAPAVHVAGTTGKGTLCALVACAVSLAGLEVGWTTSPHLCDLRERIRLGAHPLADEAWCRALGAVLVAEAGLSQDPATFFELVVLSALVAFRQAEVDLAVVEVGLGGRLDATRAVHPSVCVVTRIGLDHRELLGADEATIAGEKAGILAAGVPLVAGPEHPAARVAIAARAHELGCPVWWLDDELSIERGQLRVPGRVLRLPDSSENPARRSAAALAGGVSLRLEALLGRSDLLSALPSALERLSWRGRCDWIEGRPPLMIDGAHDASSAQALAAAYRARAGESRAALVLAVALGKDLGGILDAVAPLAEVAWTCAAHPTRALAPVELAEALLARGVRATPGAEL